MNLCGEFLAHALSATRCLQTSGFRGLGRISAQAPSYHSQRDLILESSLHTPLCHQCINTTAFAVQRKVICTHTTSTLQCQYKILCSVSTRHLQCQYKLLVVPVQGACSASTSCCVLMFAPDMGKLAHNTISFQNHFFWGYIWLRKGFPHCQCQRQHACPKPKVRLSFLPTPLSYCPFFASFTYFTA